jgi:hypothetical protein
VNSSFSAAAATNTMPVKMVLVRILSFM